MYTKAAIISTLAAVAAAAPVADPRNFFAAISSHSGNQEVHLRGINANGGAFYLNKATATYCPTAVEGLDCSKFGNSTVFAFNPSSKTLSMDVQVPGGQQVYVQADGALGYTTAHSANIPNDAYTSEFQYTPQTQAGNTGTLTFQDKASFVACPTGEGEVFQVYWSAAGAFCKTDCIGIGFATAQWDGAIAYEYTA